MSHLCPCENFIFITCVFLHHNCICILFLCFRCSALERFLAFTRSVPNSEKNHLQRIAMLHFPSVFSIMSIQSKLLPTVAMCNNYLIRYIVLPAILIFVEKNPTEYNFTKWDHRSWLIWLSDPICIENLLCATIL